MSPLVVADQLDVDQQQMVNSKATDRQFFMARYEADMNVIGNRGVGLRN
jgi:hypothetical protein